MDGNLVTFALLSLSSILVIVNPFTATLTFVSLTPDLSLAERVAAVKVSTRYALVILLTFAILGGIILQLFGITLEAFRIAGGMLLFLIGMDMVYARPSRTKITQTERTESIEAEEIAVIPLAFPMIAGPGAITTTIVLMNEAQNDLVKIAIIMISILIAIILTYAMMLRSDYIVKRIGQREYRAINRLMGMLLLAIAVQFVINGIKVAFPAVTGG
ncbi:MAG: MarC family protein [Methanoregulaceae archaeon]|nr:MarC family protein [Methanoregulaceae archaeon]